ncbi:metal ABC transporter permease [Candidatus Woesearchaeota archaeon]|nr:metal ABC transporter permease [Candidatus Woesearchaeota archaeon]
MLQAVLAPFAYDFMVKAVLVSALVGLVCAVLSCYITLKGWSLMGDAISHSVVPGVAVSYILGIPFAIGAFIFGFGATIAIGYIKSKTRIKEDAVIGVVFTGFFALGIVIISKTPSTVDITHILFGNVLGMLPSDIVQTVIISLITLLGVFILRKDLLLYCFDQNHARSIGLNTDFLYYALFSLLALTVVASQITVGIILVIAMLITPGSFAYLLTDRFDHMMMLAIACGVFSSVAGTYISYLIDASTGGTIVVLQALIFVAAMILAPKRGLLAVRRLRHESKQEMI